MLDDVRIRWGYKSIERNADSIDTVQDTSQYGRATLGPTSFSHQHSPFSRAAEDVQYSRTAKPGAEEVEMKKRDATAVMLCDKRSTSYYICRVYCLMETCRINNIDLQLGYE